MLKNRFYMCSKNVKNFLFKTYLSSIYGSSLWVLNHQLEQKITTAYNNAFRIIHDLPRYTSASKNFVHNRVNNLLAVRRSSCFSLSQRLRNSDNLLIKFIFNSSIHNNSILHQEWKKLLY